MAQKTETELLYKGLNGGPNLIANFSKTTFRSAKIMVNASSNVNQQMSEIYVIHDGNTAYMNTSNLIDSLGVFTTFEANTDNSTVYVYATSSQPNTDLGIYVTSYSIEEPANDEKLHLDSVVSTAALMSTLYPDSNVDFASQLTSCLDKEKQLAELNVRIDRSIAYMQTAEFLARPAAEQASYMNDLASSINNISDDLNSAVDSDIRAFKQYTQDIDSMVTVASLNNQYQNPAGKKILDKVLKRDVKTAFSTIKPFFNPRDTANN